MKAASHLAQAGTVLRAGNAASDTGAAVAWWSHQPAAALFHPGTVLFQRILETTHEGVWTVDLAGITTYVNPPMARLLLCAPEQMLGRSVFSFVYPEDRLAVRRRFIEFLHNPNGQQVEERLRRSDGKPLWMLVAANVLCDARGQPAGFLGMFTDITERKRAEEALRLRLEGLEVRVQARTAELERTAQALRESELRYRHLLEVSSSALTRNVELEREILDIAEKERRRLGQDLHDDLCQRLAGIQFLSQRLAGCLARHGAGGAAQAREIACLVQNALTQVRDLAHGLAPAGPEPERLPDALRKLAAQTRRVFSVDCRFQNPPPHRLLDPAVAFHLYRIAQEAVGNAIKHAHPHCIDIRLSTQDSSASLAVRDDGLGLPRRPGRTKGLGLGLMRRRAEVLGGSLQLQRQPGGGTAVICTIPLSSRADAKDTR